MKTDTEPPRPATILSPYGEGYCTVCRFVEPLGPDGRIEEHFRSGDQEVGRAPAPCKGSWERPPAVTPYRSTLSAFRLTARKAYCPECSRKVAISPGRKPFFLRHTTAKAGYAVCFNSFEPPE